MERDVVKVIYKISQNVLSITEEEFEELTEMANNQLNYCNALKPSTTQKQRELGKHNLTVINALFELQKILKKGGEI